uniref:hypothetical protein n=1 Tax=Aliarcobacter sp. TaxID=2321116 RepID=UPI0040481352
MKNNKIRDTFDLEKCLKIDPAVVQKIRNIFGKAILEYEKEVENSAELNFLFYPHIGVKITRNEVKIRDEKNEYFKITKDNSISLSLGLFEKILILPMLAKYRLFRKFKNVEKLLLKSGFLPTTDLEYNQLVFKLAKG